MKSVWTKLGAQSRAVTAGVMAVLLFGASFVAMKLALAQVEPGAVLTVRFGLGLIVLWPLLIVRYDKPPGFTWSELVRTALLGGAPIFLNQWFQAVGMVSAGAATASWLAALAPTFMVILAWIVLNERMVALQWVGIVLSLGGALLVSGADPGVAFAGVDWIAPAFLLASALAWAVFSVFGKSESQRTSPLRAMVLAMTWALLFSGVMNLITGVGWAVGGWTLQTYAALLFLGFACTGLAYGLYFYALSGAHAALIAGLQYLEPLITIALAYLLLGEKSNHNAFIGGLFIILGIFIVERVSRTEQEGMV